MNNTMFTGLVTTTTSVIDLQCNSEGGMCLTVEAFADDVSVGDSVALDGCCLTVVSCDKKTVAFDLSHATQERTTFVSLRQGQLLNVEQSLCLGARVHGHLVSGHVDMVVEVVSVQGSPARGLDIGIVVPRGYESQVFAQASVVLNGVSLTVVELLDGGRVFTVCLIPETCRRTNLVDLVPQQRVNFESDMLGKYVVSWCAKHQAP